MESTRDLKKLLERAIAASGGPSALARELKVRPQNVSNWRKRGGVPAAVVIERPDIFMPELADVRGTDAVEKAEA